jgi:5-methylcytosine-specific restriction protein A
MARMTTRPCAKCNGRGSNPLWRTNDGRCFRCHGTGAVAVWRRRRQTFRIRIKFVVPQWIIAALLALAYSLMATHDHNQLGATAGMALAAFLTITGVRSARRDRTRLPEALREAVFARDGWHCKRCGSDHKLAVDHIRPLARGGSDRITNLQTLCGSCNSSKGTK